MSILIVYNQHLLRKNENLFNFKEMILKQSGINSLK